MTKRKNKQVRKTVRASGPPATVAIESRSAKFPLDRMPVELVRMICNYLTPTQVASIRSVSRTVAAIGLEYIATTVTLTLKEESFDRLLEIAHHPVVSKYVQELHYEHDFLTNLSRKQWEDNIITPASRAIETNNTSIQAPRFGASERAWRAYYRECHVYTLEQAYSTYQNHCAEQELARRSKFFFKKLIEGLQHLPNLTTICMPSLGNYSRYKTEIAKTLGGAFYDQSNIQSNSVAVTRSVLLAMDQVVRDGQNRNDQPSMTGGWATPRARRRTSSAAIADDPIGSNQAGQSGNTPNGRNLGESDLGSSNQRVLHIRKFTSESLNWRLLLEDDEVFAAMKRSISHLSKLAIRFLDNCWIKTSHVEPPGMHESLRRGHLQEFVTSAPGLEELDVSFGLKYTYLGVPLTEVVGSFHWASLRSVHLCGIMIGVNSLGAFCSRHTSTLSDLSLGYMLMDRLVPDPRRNARNAWCSIFTKILETTKLNKARVYGVFGRMGYWDMNDHRDVRRASGTLIGRYLVGEGGCSGLKAFLTGERLRISEEDGEHPISDTG